MADEVLIIGGGVIGLSIARELKRAGTAKVTILEKASVGQEASWAAAGMLGPQAEASEADTFFKMCSESRDLYPRLATDLLEETGVGIELDTTGTLYLSFDEGSSERLRERFRGQTAADLAVEALTAEEVIEAEPHVSPAVQLGLYFPNDWQVENRRLLFALSHYAELSGIEIREGSQVSKVIVENGRAVGARTGEGDIMADVVILATGAWTSLIEVGTHAMPFEVRPVRGQIVAFEPEARLFEHVIHSHSGYLVPRTDGRVLAGSTSEGVGFDKAITDEAAVGLREVAAEIAPEFRTLPITDHWAGLRPFAGDGLPVLGNIPGVDDLYVATAHYRNGILLAPLTAEIVARAVLCGEGSEYFSEFGPARFTGRGAATNS
jgi:glycine oxidase